MSTKNDAHMKKAIILGLFLIVVASAQAQLIKTQLVLTVRDVLNNRMGNATVMLFETEADYKSETNAAFEGTTDDKGVIQLKGLKPITYWVVVRKDDKDNIDKGEIIGPIKENRINKATVIIE